MEGGLKTLGFTILPSSGAMIGGFLTKLYRKEDIYDWSKSLKSPSWKPPAWCFGPIWGVLHSGMGYASYLVWRDGGGFEGARLPLTLYASQLLLNWAWTPIFFGAHNLKLAFYEILLLYGNVAACGYYFYQVNRTAGYLFVPYLAWLTLASTLSYVIYRDNKTPAIKGASKQN